MSLKRRIEESNRLEVIASFVDNGSIVADVGSDHCQVPILLCKQGKCSHIQAIENKKGPYKRMCNEIFKSGYSSIISPSLSDGISELEKEIDTLIIAGMGGRLIKRILESNAKELSHINTIIIDAHSDSELIFKYMASISYKLEENKFIYDAGKPYDIQKWMKVEKLEDYSEEDVLFGPLNIKREPETWIYYWSCEAHRIEEILASGNLPNEINDKYLKQLRLIEKVVFNNN